MIKFKQLSLLLLVVFWGLIGCEGRSTLFWRDIPRVVTSEPAPTPAGCTNWPEEMKVRAALQTDTSIILELEGVQPGEQLVFLFTGEIPGTSSARVESRPAAAVGEDGRFTWDVGLATNPQINHWQGKIIHRGGVACFGVTLPLLETPVMFPAQQ